MSTIIQLITVCLIIIIPCVLGWLLGTYIGNSKGEVDGKDNS